MIFISGKHKANIKTYTENHQSCPNCKAFDLEIEVYKEYFHLYLIPFFPVDDKTVEITCKNCKEVIYNKALLEHYTTITKVPFYLYSGPILVILLIAFIINLNLNTQEEKAKFVEDPKVGDVYTIRRDDFNSPTYHFFKIIKINSDTIVTYSNNRQYEKFISQLEPGDYYNKERKRNFLKTELKSMLNRREINSIEREDE